jgi:predicted HicB family RNase H-like nuclease
MAISDKNTRIIVTIPKELKAIIEALAKKDDRSTNNLIIKILSDYMRSLTP